MRQISARLAILSWYVLLPSTQQQRQRLAVEEYIYINNVIERVRKQHSSKQKETPAGRRFFFFVGGVGAAQT